MWGVVMARGGRSRIETSSIPHSECHTGIQIYINIHTKEEDVVVLFYSLVASRSISEVDEMMMVGLPVFLV